MTKKDHQDKQWVKCDVEQEYFGDDRKLSKEERKRRQSQDRSKYKKTDQKKLKKAAEQQEKNPEHENLLRGRVLSIQSEGITVEHEKDIFLCKLRGALKKEKTQFKNLVTVGDFVLFENIESGEGSIAFIEPRTSTLSRADNLSRRKEQLIAANIEQVLITVSVIIPQLKPFLVDRYIIAAKKGNMQPVVLINKIDLLDENSDDPVVQEQKILFDDFMMAYTYTDIPIIPISATTGEGIQALKDVMKDKASVFSGQSGVGKSTLINEITGLDLRIGDAVLKTRKGAHTTTMAQLLQLDFGGWCIDTPGIKSFGVWDLQKKEIEEHYEEIYKKGSDCKFPNCTHTHEIDCAVKEAVENGEISALRYDSYAALLEAVDEEHKRR